jgi:hypothetical protein
LSARFSTDVARHGAYAREATRQVAERSEQVTVPPKPCLAAYPQGEGPIRLRAPCRAHRAAVVSRMGRFPASSKEKGGKVTSLPCRRDQGSRAPGCSVPVDLSRVGQVLHDKARISGRYGPPQLRNQDLTTSGSGAHLVLDQPQRACAYRRRPYRHAGSAHPVQ